jgi:hypothetical protein
MAVAGPLLGSLAAIGDRSVERTLPADLSSAWGATLGSLARIGVRVDETDRSGERWTLSGKGGAITLHAALERVTTGMSRVSLRVETGGLLADKRTAEEILNQITASLGARAATTESSAAPTGDRSAEQMAALRHEIERLGTKLEEAGKRRPPEPAAAVTPSTPTFEGPVFVIPASVGVPIVTGPDGLSLPAGPRKAAPPAQRGAGEGDVPTHAPRLQTELAPGLFPTPLQAADVLAPVDGLLIPNSTR